MEKEYKKQMITGEYIPTDTELSKGEWDYRRPDYKTAVYPNIWKTDIESIVDSALNKLFENEPVLTESCEIKDFDWNDAYKRMISQGLLTADQVKLYRRTKK